MNIPKVNESDTAFEKLRKCQDFNHLESIRNALWRMPGSAAVMIGSGFSKNAVPANPNPAPMIEWSQLTERLERRVSNSKLINGGMQALRIASIYESEHGATALDAEIANAVPDLDWSPGRHHEKLVNLPWVDVFTTNWDTLLERADASSRRYDVVKTQKKLARAQKPRIVKLHGSFPEDQPWIVTEEHFRTYPAEYPAFVNTFRQCLLENVICMIGFSGDDPNFHSWLGWVRDCLKDYHPGVFLIDKDLGNSDRKYLEKRGIKAVALGDQFDSHPEAIEAVLDYLALPPNKPTFSPPNDSGLSSYEALAELKKSFPGWLVPPQNSATEITFRLNEALSDPTLNEERAGHILWAAKLSGVVIPTEVAERFMKEEWEGIKHALLEYYLLRFDSHNARKLQHLATPLQLGQIAVLEGDLESAKSYVKDILVADLDTESRLALATVIAEVGDSEGAIDVLRRIVDESVRKPTVRTDSLQSWALFIKSMIERARDHEPISEEVMARFGVFARTANDPYRLIHEQEEELKRERQSGGLNYTWSNLPEGPRRNVTIELGNSQSRTFPLRYLGQAHIPIGIHIAWFKEVIARLFFEIPNHPTILSALHRDASDGLLDSWVGLSHLTAMPSDWRRALLSRSQNVLDFAFRHNNQDLLTTQLRLAGRLVRVAEDDELAGFIQFAKRGCNSLNISVETLAIDLFKACMAGRSGAVWRENIVELLRFPLARFPHWFDPFAHWHRENEAPLQLDMEEISNELSALERDGSLAGLRRAAYLYAQLPELRQQLSDFILAREQDLRQMPEFSPHFFDLLGLPTPPQWNQAVENLRQELVVNRTDSFSTLLWRKTDELLRLYTKEDCVEAMAPTVVQLVDQVVEQTLKLGKLGPLLALSPPNFHLWQHLLSLLVRDFPVVEKKVLLTVEKLQNAGIPTTSVDLQLGKQDAVVRLLTAISGTRDERLSAHYYLAKIKDLPQQAIVEVAKEILENVTKSDPFHVFDMLSLLTGSSSEMLLNCIVENPDLFDRTITFIGLLDERTRVDMDTVYDPRNRHLKGSEDGRPSLRWLLSVWVARLASIDGLSTDPRFEPVRNRWLTIGSDPQELPEVRKPWLQ